MSAGFPSSRRAALARLRRAADSPRARSSAARPSARARRHLGERPLDVAGEHDLAQVDLEQLEAECGGPLGDELGQAAAAVEALLEEGPAVDSPMTLRSASWTATWSSCS